MLRLLVLIVVIILTAATTILFAGWFGARQPSPAQALFTNADGTPCEFHCIFAIRPGQTPYEEVATVFRSHPLSVVFESSGYVWNGPRGTTLYVGNMLGQTPPVHSVILSMDLGGAANRLPDAATLPTQVTVGDLLSQLGIPDAVRVDRTQVYLYFLRTQPVIVARLALNAPRQRFDATDFVTDLALLDLNTCKASLQDGYNTWLGLSSVQRYNRVKLTKFKSVAQSLAPLVNVVPCPL